MRAQKRAQNLPVNERCHIGGGRTEYEFGRRNLS